MTDSCSSESYSTSCDKFSDACSVFIQVIFALDSVSVKKSMVPKKKHGSKKKTTFETRSVFLIRSMLECEGWWQPIVRTTVKLS